MDMLFYYFLLGNPVRMGKCHFHECIICIIECMHSLDG